MAEIKHTFTGGKMNKDLDERLVRNGEYRSAMNVKVRSTDSDSSGEGASGTVQNLKGNTLVGSTFFQDWMAQQISPTEALLNNSEDRSQFAKCVASVGDEKNDKGYFFFAAPLLPSDVTDLIGPTTTFQERVYVDSIIEQSSNGESTPVVIDVFTIIDSRANVVKGSGSNPINQNGPFSSFMVNAGFGKKYRPGMSITLYDVNGNVVFKSKIKAIDGDAIMLTEEVTEPGAANLFVFEAERVLNFKSTREVGKPNFITGINIIDNLLFWTDNHSEPKKINIDRCKAGTNVGSTNDLRTQTKLFIKHPVTKQLTDVADIDNELDNGGTSNGSGVNSYLQEKHITVKRKAPTSAPTLHMKSSDRDIELTTVSINEYPFVDVNTNQTLDFGAIKVITDGALNDSQFRKDDILIFTEQEPVGSEPVVIKAKFICYQDALGAETLEVTGNIRIKIISNISVSIGSTSWEITLQQKKPLFETTLARFGYRYKYADGEYSSFSPWSELAFLPGAFDYSSKKAFNLGMVNTLRELVIKDFIPYKKPLDVVAVDIIYKTTSSANVYVVETIEKVKDSEWEAFTPDGQSTTTDIKTGQLAITSEMIHRVLPANQTLRSWDNVPRYALAQEITANRLIYGNYLQGYNINENINITQEIRSENTASVLSPKKSIKSLRDYKVGLVYGDKYGRETPVITSGYTTEDASPEGFSSVTGDLVVPKTLAPLSSSIVVSQKWGDSNNSVSPPEWIDYVKYYVKETTNEYYNLIMDRWYDASGENDNSSNHVWLSFNSADRNKIDEESHLILKNHNGSNQPVVEKARYKVLAIENEAPDHIKTNYVPIGKIEAITPAATGVFAGNVEPNLQIWATDTGDPDALGTPTGLYTGTSIKLTTAVWNTFGIGLANHDEGVFGRAIKGDIKIRIIGANVVSGVVTAQMESEWRRLTHFHLGAFNNNAECVVIKWDKKFDEGDVDMLARFTSAALTSSVFTVTNLKYHLEFKEAVKSNEPEFDGKFFVKIERDLILNEAVTNLGIGSTSSYEPSGVFDLSYIEAKAENQHEMDSPPNTVETSANFSSIGTTVGFFNNVFNNITNLSADNFATAGTDSNLASYINPNIQIIQDGYPQAEFSPFGTCDTNFNLATRDFWDFYENLNTTQRSGNGVFIDAVNIAGDNFELDMVTNNGDFTQLAGDFADVIHPNGSFTKINPMQKGFMTIPGSTIVGATNDTIGCIALSFNAVNDSILSPTNDLIDALTPGQMFQFQDNLLDSNGDKIIYKVVGIPIKGGTSNKNYLEDPIPTFEGGIPNCLATEGRRITTFIEFRRMDLASGAVSTVGLNLAEFDPRAFLHHDGRDSIKINLIKSASTTFNGESQSSENGACFETEPKENVDLELYYEASNAIPMVLNESNIFDYAPINSKISINRVVSTDEPTNTDIQETILSPVYQFNENNELEPLLPNAFTRINHRVSNAYFMSDVIENNAQHAIVSIVSDDAEEFVEVDGGGTTTNSNFNNTFIHKQDIAIGDNIFFKHQNGTTTQGLITSYYKPVDPQEELPGNTSFNAISTADNDIGIVSGPKPFELVQSVDYIFAADGFNDLTTSISSSLSGSVNDYVTGVRYTNSSGVQVSSATLPQGISILKVTAVGALNYYTFSEKIGLWFWNQAGVPSNATNIVITLISPTGYYGISKEVHEQPVKLHWHNCYSFGNGVESDRIRDDFNASQIDNGVKVSTTFSGYKEENISSGLIYSGLYNSVSQVNDLNEFNMAEKITKDLNPTYGSIQALKTRNSDVVVLAEDKVLKVLSNKDAVFNADGNPQLVATNRVLGQAVPFAGDYGISKNPESLASDQYRLYFTDKQRGAVLRLSRDGLTPISSVGMKSWFRNYLNSSKNAIGSFDVVNGEYNLTILSDKTSASDRTLSFSEGSKGWTSFKSFILNNGLSFAGKYYTAVKNKIYEHDADTDVNGVSVNRNTFYGSYVNSSITIMFNDNPGDVKSFKYLNYEGSQSRIIPFTGTEALSWTNEVNQDANGNNVSVGQTPVPVNDGWHVMNGLYYNNTAKDGWFAASMETDLQSGQVREFIDKEGKWFNHIKGTTTATNNVDSSEFTVQGVGQIAIDAVWWDDTPGDTGSNCFPLCTDSQVCINGECTDIVQEVYGCMDENAANYNENATLEGQCIYNITGCTNPLASNYNALADIDDGSCEQVVVGCMDSTAINFNPLATTDGAFFGSSTSNPIWNEIQYYNCCYAGQTCDGSEVEIIGCMDCGTDWEELSGLLCPATIALGLTSAAQNPNVGGDGTGASNFDPTATTSGNSICTYRDTAQEIMGCTDESAVNFNPDANVNDGSCEDVVFGCTDDSYCNYNPNANEDDGSCVEEGTTIVGCMDEDNIFYNPCATIDNPDDCFGDSDDNTGEFSQGGCMDNTAFNYNPTATWDNGTCTPVIFGCTDETAFNYNIEANTNIGEGGVGECVPVVFGCTDTQAFNYNGGVNNSGETGVNTDNGSCLPRIYGCMDETAFNYNNYNTDTPNVGQPVVTGTDAILINVNTPCGTVVDLNGNVNQTQSANPNFGGGVMNYCCIEVIEGCMDPMAPNYNPLANTSDGSCETIEGLTLIVMNDDEDVIDYIPTSTGVTDPTDNEIDPSSDSDHPII